MQKSKNTSLYLPPKQTIEPQAKRFEYKYWINWKTYTQLKARIKNVLTSDPNSDLQGKYTIRSVYFDSPQRHCVREKEDGLENRKKYRARSYGTGDIPTIKFEIKYRDKHQIWKQSISLSKQEYLDFITTKSLPHKTPFTNELVHDFRSLSLSPITIVQYTREAYIYPFSNVRITFDSSLCHSSFCTDIFSDHPKIYAHPKDRLILEVKFDRFLPPLISSLLYKQLPQRTSISKYILCYQGAYRQAFNLPSQQ